jgi:cytochrome c oxidase subunit II
VYEAGTQAELTGKPLRASQLPTLYLPVGERVEFVLTSRDVIHSFWVPAFLFKQDVIPGRNNHFQLTPTKEGSYSGKCAELCGRDHSRMLFNVVVLPPDEFKTKVDEAKAGNP